MGNVRTVYFPKGMLEEIEREAARLGMTISSLLAEAWRVGRAELASLAVGARPSGGAPDDDDARAARHEVTEDAARGA